MKKGNLQKPTRMEQARARLDAAVARLEAATENTAHKGPSDEISRELEQLRAENSEFKALHEDTSLRLDAAIGRLRSAIGE